MSRPSIAPTNDGGRRLVPEPACFAGLSDFGDICYFRNGLATLLQNYLERAITEGMALPEERATEIFYTCVVHDAAVDYCQDYLVRRVHALEEELGLKPQADIDIRTAGTTEEGCGGTTEEGCGGTTEEECGGTTEEEWCGD